MAMDNPILENMIPEMIEELVKVSVDYKLNGEEIESKFKLITPQYWISQRFDTGAFENEEDLDAEIADIFEDTPSNKNSTERSSGNEDHNEDNNEDSNEDNTRCSSESQNNSDWNSADTSRKGSAQCRKSKSQADFFVSFLTFVLIGTFGQI